MIKKIYYRESIMDGRYRCWRCGVRGLFQVLTYVCALDTDGNPIFQGNYCKQCRVIKIAEAEEVEIKILEKVKRAS